MDDSYVVISPCRNEADFMVNTLETVVNQSVTPAKWIIVDDGSTDSTPEILQRYADQYDFIQIVTRDNRGHRSVGPGVIEAFYAGLEVVDLNDYQFVCKLDLDLELPSKYFELLMQRMRGNPRIGTCSGKPYNRHGDRLVSERRGDEMSVGMTKFYRMTCFRQIGGFVSEVMWDAIDCHRCRQLGWLACSWDDPQLRFIHLRIMGSSQNSIYSGRMRHGFGQYFMGTGLVYMFATSVFRMFHPPYITGGMAMFWGYLKSLLQRVPRYQDRQLREFICNYQWKCLLMGKSRATRQLDDRQAAVWDQQIRFE
jgi:biofilm PGA synthesis N-glycosyltransferase PgaC